MSTNSKALLQDSPRSELVRQGPVIIHERKVLPSKVLQKSQRERHLFLFETALILCKKTENKEYVARNTIPISKLQFESSNDYFTVWGKTFILSMKIRRKLAVSIWKLIVENRGTISDAKLYCTLFISFVLKSFRLLENIEKQRTYAKIFYSTGFN